MKILPPAVCGLWRRGSIVFPDGRKDAETRVFWLQTQSLFADIRVPARRLCPTDAQGFDDLSDNELVGLASLQGFAGTLDFEGGVCLWHRELDFRPPDGSLDEAKAEIDGDTLIETGIHSDYVEDWYRDTPPDAPLAAFRYGGDRAGILVFAGDYFIEIVDRRDALPRDTNLAELVRADLAEGDRAAAVAKLDMRISFGKRTPDGAWEVTLSTHPWRVGSAVSGSETAWRLIDGSVPAGAWFPT